MTIVWEKSTQEKFELLISKVPFFLRDVAREKVSKKSESLVLAEGRAQVTQKDMIDAFFSETPFGFHGPLKNDMEELGIDYTAYGHPK